MVFLRIIIPTKNEESYLPKIMNSIKKQNFKDLEVFVADSNSSDNTRSIAKSYGCTIIKGGYPSTGRNNGVKNCNTPMLCFIDCDVILPNSNFIRRSLKEFEGRGLDLAGTLQSPILTNRKISDLMYAIFWGVSNIALNLAKNTRKPFMQNLMFMKTEVHKNLGGFPSYEFGEDSYLAEVAVARGYKFGILREGGKVFLSPRRFENKGFFKMLTKYVYFNTLRIFGHEFKKGKTRVKYW